MRKSSKLPFPLVEYEERLARVRDGMQRANLDVLLVSAPENTYYLSGSCTYGYTSLFEALVVPREGEPFIVTRLFEQPMVVETSWLEDIVVYRDGEDPIELTRRVLSERGLNDKRIGVEKRNWFLTVRNFERLKASLPRVHFEDCSGLVEDLRVVKSEREIEYIREAARAAEKGMRAGIEAVGEGRTENDVAIELYRGSIASGSEWTGFAPFVASGYRAALPHATWAGRRLARGDEILLEVAGCVKRYSAAMIRPVSVGEPHPLVTKAADTSRAALEATIKAMKPGSTAAEVDQICRKTIAEAGLIEFYTHRSAYSIGIGFYPDWGEGHILSFWQGDNTPLQAGMVFHVIPNLLIPGVGGIGITETVLVTETGGESLTNLERRLFIK